jgi:cyclic pyranopterin phosphate synthase
MEKKKQTQSNKLIDKHGRIVNYLRISLTDRCNLKCIYCHPPHKIDYLDRSEICSYADLLEIMKIAVKIGIDKIRLTGGELFLRKGITNFFRSLRNLEGLKEITMTTNGTLLLPHLKELKKAGINRINVSLDTLSKDLFHYLTGSRKFDDVLEAIHAALHEVFRLKINMVILRGINDGEIIRFIDTFLRKSVEVRFIEFMPLCGSGWREDYFFPYKKIKETIASAFELYPLPSSGVAQEFAVGNSHSIIGRVGIIASVTRSFCDMCSRLRLSAKGELMPCLISRKKIDLLPILRSGRSTGQIELDIESAFRKIVALKSFNDQTHSAHNSVYIRSIGG